MQLLLLRRGEKERNCKYLCLGVSALLWELKKTSSRLWLILLLHDLFQLICVKYIYIYNIHRFFLEENCNRKGECSSFHTFSFTITSCSTECISCTVVALCLVLILFKQSSEFIAGTGSFLLALAHGGAKCCVKRS